MTAPHIDIDRLEAVAKALPLDTWKVQHPCAGERGWEVADSTGLEQIADALTLERAEYVAATNPAVVLELVARLRRAEAAISAVRSHAGQFQSFAIDGDAAMSSIALELLNYEENIPNDPLDDVLPLAPRQPLPLNLPASLDLYDIGRDPHD